MRKSIWTLCIVALLMGLSGCGTIHTLLRTQPAPISAFLPDHELLVRQPDTFPFHYFYMKDLDKKYRNVYIAPVDTGLLRTSSQWNEFNRALAGHLGQDIQALADYMREQFAAAFRKVAATSGGHLAVVDDPRRPDTLVVAPAITAIVPTKAELNYLGTAVGLVVPGAGFVAGCFASGSLAVECKVYDGATGEIVAMYADAESDRKALFNLAGFTWYGSAKLNIRALAEQSAEVLSREDFHSIERDFPFALLTW